MGRAAAHYASGAMELALADYAESVKRFPQEPQPFNDFAWLLATGTTDGLRDGTRAIELATTACKLTDFKNAAYLDTLAAAYAEKGDFASAVKWQEEAVKFSREEPPEVQEQMKQRVESYRGKKPFREAPGAVSEG
jgi:tetratricopeptide (TPR) repeat protein